MNSKLKKLLSILPAFVLIAVASVTLASCGESKEEAATSDGIIRAYGCEPQHTLVPGNTGETCGGNVIDLIFSPLVKYNKDGNPVNEVADSITSDDNQTWDIKIKDGWVFTNGEPVTAQSFVDSWNYTANTANAQGNQYFFDVIEGFDEVSADEATADLTLSGLNVVSDTEFTVTLSAPSVTFPIRLGYTAFDPLPKSFFDDPEAFGEAPIGNGPYKLTSWEHDTKLEVRPSDTYAGENKPANNGVDFVVYSGNASDTAFTDVLAGNLDAVETTKTENYQQYKDDQNVQWVVEETPAFQSFGIPAYLPHFAFDDEGKLRRQAISLALNRPSYIEKLNYGLGAVPKGFAPDVEVINGAAEPIENDGVFEYNATKAAELWAEADGINPWGDDESFDIYYNGDSGGQEAFDAYANSINEVLGITSKAVPTPDFKTLLQQCAKGELKGAARAGWQPDYPSVENYLQPLYTTDADSNYWDYSSPEFDQLILDAATAESLDAANALYVKAQEILIKDLPVIPTTYGYNKGAYSPKVQNVAYTWKGAPDYLNMSK
ncbi:MAG: ABC transporter substrate-binding protein [Candidatus Ancillula sp.]|jgi:oligopeptide transport system substrate-binding protein|nr:ABC transporter substrate-binding protein [Candidatus Ancillula sp.]